MRLMMIIVAEEQETYVKEVLEKEQCYLTKVGSNGDFLQYGEIIFMVGVPKEKAERILQVFQELEKDIERQIRIYSIPAQSLHI